MNQLRNNLIKLGEKLFPKKSDLSQGYIVELVSCWDDYTWMDGTYIYVKNRNDIQLLPDIYLQHLNSSDNQQGISLIAIYGWSAVSEWDREEMLVRLCYRLIDGKLIQAE